MIEMTTIEKVFRTETVETKALAGVDLTIKQGEFVAIMGPSGCGKSTLLGILGLIDKATRGSYRFEGEEVATLPERLAARRRRERIGFVFQQFNLVDELTVAENVALALRYRSMSAGERKRRIEEALDRVAIGHRARHFPAQLSGGQQQRAAIARAVVGGPALLLADEPTGNLDSNNGREVMRLLSELNAQGSTLIMVTHAQFQADQAHRCIHMLDGRVIGDSTNQRPEAA